MPTVLRMGFLDMQICVPETYNDTEVIAFAEKEFPCGTSGGWFIVREGSKWLGDNPERAQCNEKSDHVHLLLEA